MNVHVLTFYDDTNRAYGYDDEPLYLVGIFTNYSDAIEAMKKVLTAYENPTKSKEIS